MSAVPQRPRCSCHGWGACVHKANGNQNPHGQDPVHGWMWHCPLDDCERYSPILLVLKEWDAPGCAHCLDTGYVCEDHPRFPWGGMCCEGAPAPGLCDHGACHCGAAGEPCPACTPGGTGLEARRFKARKAPEPALTMGEINRALGIAPAPRSPAYVEVERVAAHLEALAAAYPEDVAPPEGQSSAEWASMRLAIRWAYLNAARSVREDLEPGDDEWIAPNLP